MDGGNAGDKSASGVRDSCALARFVPMNGQRARRFGLIRSSCVKGPAFPVAAAPQGRLVRRVNCHRSPPRAGFVANPVRQVSFMAGGSGFANRRPSEFWCGGAMVNSRGVTIALNNARPAPGANTAGGEHYAELAFCSGG